MKPPWDLLMNSLMGKRLKYRASDGDHRREGIDMGCSFEGSPAKRYRPVNVCLILLPAVFMYCWFLGGYPLADPDEGRYAEIAREMLESGDFVTPHLNYVRYLEKPPLYYWLLAGSMAVFGENEWAVRLVSAATALLSVLVVMILGRSMFGPRTGLTAGWVYLTSVLPLVLARISIIDTLFSLCLLATWGAWWLGYRAKSMSRSRGWTLLFWACLGLATMAKGLAALVLTGLIILIFVSVRRGWGVLRDMAWWPGPAVFGIIVIPWHVAVGYRNPDFWHYYIVVEHFARLLGDEHVRPFWYLPAIVPFGMMFWGVFLFPAARNAVRCSFHMFKFSRPTANGTLDKRQNGVPSEPGYDQWRAESILFLVIWAFTVIVLFSLSRCKLMPYVLPAYPAMALLVAWHLNSGALQRPSTGWCLAFTTAILLMFILSLPYVARQQTTMPLHEISGLLRVTQCALLVGTGLVVFSIFRRRMAIPVLGLILLFLVPPLALTAQMITQYRKIGAFVKSMPNPLPKGIKIAEWRTYDQSLGFYTKRRIILVDEVSELVFRHTSSDYGLYFLEGEESLKRLAVDGPLLVNLRPGDWQKVRQWDLLFPVAANTSNMMVANKAFFHLTNLEPWPEAAIKPRPLLLMPRKVDEEEKCVFSASTDHPPDSNLE